MLEIITSIINIAIQGLILAVLALLVGLLLRSVLKDAEESRYDG